MDKLIDQQDQQSASQRSDSADYFDALYHNSHDPWEYEQRWYEQRKRQICMALLLKPMYENVLEIGCSNGVFSAYLAQRAQRLICLDANLKAVQLAQARLQHSAHVTVMQQCIPEQFPTGTFDLIVISEIMYYLAPEQLFKLIEKVQTALAPNGIVLCCHWRYAIEGFSLNGENVHCLLKQQFALHHYLHLDDADFVLDIWSKESASLAMQEGLI